MKIQRFVCNMFEENCYVVSDDSNECVIVDCGAFYEEEKRAIIGYIRDNNLQLKHLLCTHGHIDHNFGNKAIFDEFGIGPEICSGDEHLLSMLREQATALVGIDYTEPQPAVRNFFSDGDTVSFGSHSFKIINTPGHSPGGVFFYCEDESMAFSGDTLFRMSIGRTDFIEGSYEDIISSLKNIVAKLPKDTLILPGHGPQTSIKDELLYNPYMK
ncbi:MAG: MBL fold metallo-hydrolase [Prevotella sp.]|nr:MBL fold metallo-hydrolase [Prevotella sp.]